MSDTGIVFISASVHRNSKKMQLKTVFWIPFSLLYSHRNYWNTREKTAFAMFEIWRISGSCVTTTKFVFLLYPPKKYIYIKLHTMVLLVDDLHDHLKSPQDPYVVVALSSLWLSSVYRMPFHLAACCSRTVNSLIAGWKLWKHTAQSTPPSKPVSSAKMILPVESKPLFQINWVWKCCFRCVLDTCCCLSKSYYLTFTQNCPQSSNLYPSETFLWINTLNYYSQSSTPPFQVSCLAMQQISSYISSEIVI